MSAATEQFRVGLVTDVSGLEDESFNRLASVGVERAEKTLYVESRVLTPGSAADYDPHLTALAEEGFSLIIGVGYHIADTVNAVAREFPRTCFAIVDVPRAELADPQPNVCGLVFKQEESGYLAGYLAGLAVEARAGKRVISSVGGLRIPPVERYIAGYEAGARAADPEIEVIVDYADETADPAPCRELAVRQVGAGSQAVFQVAGGCGRGALEAVREHGVWGIGVDADQSYLGKHVLTSALKRIDVAVFKSIRMTRSQPIERRDLVFGLAEGGTGLGRISERVPAPIVAKVKAVEREVAAGAVQIATRSGE